jgi:dihydroorotase
LDQGQFGFLDVRRGRIEGTERLICEMTIRAGDVVFDLNGRTGVDWRKASIDYPTK